MICLYICSVVKKKFDCKEKWDKRPLPTWRADARVVATQFVASLSLFSSPRQHLKRIIVLNLHAIHLPGLFFSGFQRRRSKNFLPLNAVIVHSLLGHTMATNAIDHWPQFLAEGNAEREVIERASDAELCWERVSHYACTIFCCSMEWRNRE